MDSPKYFDNLIIGAGPAGLQLAYFLQQRGRDYVILDGGDRAGQFFDRFPRQGNLISINKVHTGYDDPEAKLRYDWNSLLTDDPDFVFPNYTSDYYASSRLYAQYLRDFADRFDLRIQFKTPIVNIRPAGDPQANGSGVHYVVTDDQGNDYACRALTVATGMSRPFIPEIPGIEHATNYWDCSIEPADYANQKLLIIGKGNSAFELANHLVGATRVTHLCSPSSVKMAWKSHYFGHLRAVNNDFLDTYILKGQNSVLDATIDKIEEDNGEYVVDITFTHAEGQRAQLAYDRIIACTGFQWSDQFFGEGCTPDTTPCGRLPAMTSAWESTNLPHLYYAGTLMQMRDQHKTMSNVLHGFRANIKSLAAILDERYEQTKWPSTRLDLCAEAIADKIIERVSTNAGLMHQPGFLSDVLVVGDDGAEYFETLAVDYVHDSHFGKNRHYYTITMEYGDTIDDLLSVNREPDPNKAYNDFYLHPRIQRFDGATRLCEHHISESLENDWRVGKHPGEKPLIRAISFHGQDDPTQFNETHRSKLVAFLRSQLTPAPSNGIAPATSTTPVDGSPSNVR